MELRKIELNGIAYEFVCDSRNTRTGFAHDCTLFKNGRQESKATCYYYNRTWENYQYQTVMRSAVGKALAELEDDLLTAWKKANGIKRLTAERKKEFMAGLENILPVKNLREVYSKL